MATTDNFMDSLSVDDIDSLLGEGRAKGQYDDPIKEFAASGEVYFVLSKHPLFKSKKPASLNSSATAVVKRLATANESFPRMRVIKRIVPGSGSKDFHVLLVNMEALEAAHNSKNGSK